MALEMEVCFVRVSHSMFLHECITWLAKPCSPLTHYTTKAMDNFNYISYMGPILKVAMQLCDLYNSRIRLMLCNAQYKTNNFLKNDLSLTGTSNCKVVPVIHSSHHKSISDRGDIASCILRWRSVVSFKTCSDYPWRNSNGVQWTAYQVGPRPCLDALKRIMPGIKTPNHGRPPHSLFSIWTKFWYSTYSSNTFLINVCIFSLKLSFG